MKLFVILFNRDPAAVDIGDETICERSDAVSGNKLVGVNVAVRGVTLERVKLERGAEQTKTKRDVGSTIWLPPGSRSECGLVGEEPLIGDRTPTLWINQDAKLMILFKGVSDLVRIVFGIDRERVSFDSHSRVIDIEGVLISATIR